MTTEGDKNMNPTPHMSWYKNVMNTFDKIEKINNNESKMKIPNPLRYNVIASYLTAKKEEKDFKIYPSSDSSPQYMIRDMVEIRTALGKMEERASRKGLEHEEMRQEMDRMIEELRRDEQRLGEHFANYEEFVNENVEKKQRAKEIIMRENELNNDLEAQILSAQVEVRKAMETRDRMKRVISTKQKFVDFLKKVCAERPIEFANIDEVENRYKLLQTLMKDAINEKTENVEKIQKESARFAKRLNEYKSEIIVRKNSITNLSLRSDTAQNELRYWTGIVDKVNELTHTNISDLEGVKESCWNLYVQVCKDEGRPVSLSNDDIGEQLNVIVKDIFEKRRALNSFKRMQMGITNKTPKSKQSSKQSKKP